jgi:hypothetical protein
MKDISSVIHLAKQHRDAIRQYYPDAKLVSKFIGEEYAERTEISVTFKVGNYDAFIPISAIFEEDAFPQDVKSAIDAIQ